jgi:hypothetical protein
VIEDCYDEAAEIIKVESENKNNNDFSKLLCVHFITVIKGHDGLGKPFSLEGAESFSSIYLFCTCLVPL